MGQIKLAFRSKLFGPSAICLTQIHWLTVDLGGVLPYQSGGGVPPEPHGAHGEREKSRNLGSREERIIEQFI